MTSILVGEPQSVEATVRLAATGDEVAFARLVQEHHASMARVAFVICGDADATRDVLQAAWTKAWRRITGLRDPRQVRAWLIAIAANEARQSIRRRRVKIVDISTQLEAAHDPFASTDVLDLQIALRGLKAEDRALLAMRYAGDLESAEIGEQLGISASGVRSRLARVLERLRTDLDVKAETDR